MDLRILGESTLFPATIQNGFVSAKLFQIADSGITVSTPPIRACLGISVFYSRLLQKLLLPSWTGTTLSQ